jgi:hypothetical protein
LVTKGDAVNHVDEYIVTRNDFLGRELWHTNLTAKAHQMCQSPQGLFLIVAVPCLATVMLFVLYKFMTRKSTQKLYT